MIDAPDKERITKTVQAANLLVQDLRELLRSENVLLADIAKDILPQVLQVELRWQGCSHDFHCRSS